MRTVSFQGTQLSASQRRNLAFQQQARAFLSPVLQEQVTQTLALAQRSHAVRPKSEWTVVFSQKGTPCLADVFGF